MTKLVNVTAILFVAFALVTLLDASAWAFGDLCSLFPRICSVVEVPPAPEIDPNLLRGTIAVLAGGVLMLAGRRRRSS